MKKTIKIFAAVMLVAAMVLSIASCGVDMNKVKGDWIVSTINGKAPADFAAENGTVEACVMKTLNITDKTVTMSSLDGTGNVIALSGDVVVRANGVEATLQGTLFGFEYKPADDTLNYTLTDGTNEYAYVLKKGTYDLAGKYAEAVAAAQAAAQGAAEEAPAAEGGEEDYSEEDYGEENYEEE